VGNTVFYGIAAAPQGISLDPSVQFLGGLAIVWVFAILALLGTKMYGRLLQVMFYIPAAITVLFFAMWIAGAMNPSLVATGVEQALGAPPSTFVSIAVSTGMTQNAVGFFSAFSYALPGAFWAYMGWYATTFLAGEVKEANKKLPMVLLTAGIIVMVVYVLATSVSAISAINAYSWTDPATGNKWSFFQAYGWLSNYGGNLSPAQIAIRNAAILISKRLGAPE
jgi:amino acid transporter